MSVSFGFHGPPLLTFKTDLLDLFQGKVTSKAHKLKISACELSLLYMQNASLNRSESPKLPCCILIDHIRILSIGLELACNGGSCGGIY